MEVSDSLAGFASLWGCLKQDGEDGEREAKGKGKREKDQRSVEVESFLVWTNRTGLGRKFFDALRW